MEPLQIADALKDFILNQLLEDEQVVELDFQTPLFELKILDSLAVVTVVNFIAGTFHVDVPLEHLTADNLRSLESMGQLVARLNTQAN
ncbi:MAG: phosphopantetheine-binding protein [Polyangiales bacterium]